MSNSKENFKIEREEKLEDLKALLYISHILDDEIWFEEVSNKIKQIEDQKEKEIKFEELETLLAFAEKTNDLNWKKSISNKINQL